MVRRRGSVLLAAAVLVLGVAAPASAHPNVVASGVLRAGRPVRLTVILIGDEGSVTGVRLTFPSSFAVTAAHPAQGRFGTLSHTAHTVSSTTVSLPFGSSGYLLVDGVPSSAADFSVDVVAHLSDGRDYRYPPVRVATVDTSEQAPAGPLGGTAGTVAIGAGVAVLAAALALLRARHRPGRSG